MLLSKEPRDIPKDLSIQKETDGSFPLDIRLLHDETRQLVEPHLGTHRLAGSKDFPPASPRSGSEVMPL